MKTTIKALDHYDALKVGHTYSLHRCASGRLTTCEDDSTHQIISLYDWQIEDGVLRGKLTYIDSPVSAAMSCTVAASLCKSLPSGYQY